METTKSFLSERLQSIKNMQIDMFMEIDINRAAEVLLANGGLTEINGITLEATTDECTIIELQDETNNVWHKVEIRLCHRSLPVARCSCARGREHIRCSHLLEAFFAFAAFGKLGLTEKITEKSSCLWMPFDWQKV